MGEVNAPRSVPKGLSSLEAHMPTCGPYFAVQGFLAAYLGLLFIRYLNDLLAGFRGWLGLGLMVFLFPECVAPYAQYIPAGLETVVPAVGYGLVGFLAPGACP